MCPTLYFQKEKLKQMNMISKIWLFISFLLNKML